MRKKYLFIVMMLTAGCSMTEPATVPPTGSKPGRALGWSRPAEEVLATRTLRHHADRGIFPPTLKIAKLSPIYDQGDVGRCTGFGWKETVEDALLAAGLPNPGLSADFIYAEERLMEGTTNLKQDTGAEVGDGAKVLWKFGVCSEKIWADDENTWKRKPTKKALTSAKSLASITTETVDLTDPNTIKAELSAGRAICFGMDVPDIFMTDAMASSGVMPQPKPGFAPVGGHCVIIIGWDDTKTYPRFDGKTGKGMYLCQNSWGTGWGQKGLFWLPAEFVHSASCTDAHVVVSLPVKKAA